MQTVSFQNVHLPSYCPVGPSFGVALNAININRVSELKQFVDYATKTLWSIR